MQLRGGSVLMGLHRGEDSTLSRLEEALVDDGEWHHLQLDISSLGGAASLHKAVLSLDQGLYLVSHSVPVGGSKRRGAGLRSPHKPCCFSSRLAWRWTASCGTPR